MKKYSSNNTAIRLLSAALLLSLMLFQTARASEMASLKDKAEELYNSYHLAPGRIEQAFDLYEKALAMDPDNYDTLWRLAAMCQIYGQSLPEDERQQQLALWEKGRDYALRATESNPDGTEGHFYYMANLGSLARAQGALSSLWKFRRIKKEMDTTLRLDPNYAPVLVARAQYLTEMPAIFGGDEAEAVALYQRALEVDPTYVIAHYYLAQIHDKHGRYDEAIACLDRLINCQNPGNPANWSKVDLPWAKKLRKEVMAKKAAEENITE